MELFRALATLAEPPTDRTAEVARLLGLSSAPTPALYTDLFVLQQVPFASAYLSGDGMVGGEPRDRIAGFWRALGLEPPAEPDHLATLLGAYAALCEQAAVCEEDAEACDARLRGALRHARRAFIWDHLLSWAPCYLLAVPQHAGEPFAAWARLLLDALLEEARELGQVGVLPLHLRDLPAIADPRRENAAAFVESLLAPARSGVIVTRADLGRGAHRLGMGVRAGERRVMLRSLLEQDARATLGWLGEEARQWQERHSCLEAVLGPIGRFWADRASATATLATELAREVGPDGEWV